MNSKIWERVAAWQNNKMICEPSEDSDQAEHPPHLIRVFAVRMKKPWDLSYPAKTQIRLGIFISKIHEKCFRVGPFFRVGRVRGNKKDFIFDLMPITLISHMAKHCNHVANSPDENNNIGAVYSCETKASVYFTLVRPNLEYCASVWSLYTAQGKYMIEMVQRRAARYAVNRYRNTSSVTEMLEDLGWETLESRRTMMSHDMSKPTKWHVRPAKTQISLGILPVWSESSLSAQSDQSLRCTLNG